MPTILMPATRGSFLVTLLKNEYQWPWGQPSEATSFQDVAGGFGHEQPTLHIVQVGKLVVAERHHSDHMP